jgi:hypothetical protein
MSSGMNTVAFFPVPAGDRYHIPIKIRGKDGMLHDVVILADTGNDVTLLRTSTSNMLGFDPINEMGQVFPVGGITGDAQPFMKIWNLIQIGNLRPTYIRMGLAEREESLMEDLLGRQDVFDSGKYSVTYDNMGVSFQEKHDPQDIATSSYGTEQLPHGIREAFRRIR